MYTMKNLNYLLILSRRSARSLRIFDAIVSCAPGLESPDDVTSGNGGRSDRC